MSDEEQNQNADAGEKEILEQAQGAAAEEQEAVSSLEEELLKWRDSLIMHWIRICLNWYVPESV